MKKKLFWGISTLIFLLVIGGVFLMRNKEQPNKKIYVVDKDAKNERNNDTKPQEAPVRVELPPLEIPPEDIPSDAEMAAYHEYMKEYLPGKIEQTQKLHDGLQKLYNLKLQLYQRDPDNEEYRKSMLQTKKHLDMRNLELSSLTKLWRDNYENK